SPFSTENEMSSTAAVSGEYLFVSPETVRMGCCCPWLVRGHQQMGGSTTDGVSTSRGIGATVLLEASRLYSRQNSSRHCGLERRPLVCVQCRVVREVRREEVPSHLDLVAD